MRAAPRRTGSDSPAAAPVDLDVERELVRADNRGTSFGICEKAKLCSSLRGSCGSSAHLAIAALVVGGEPDPLAKTARLLDAA